MFILSAADLSQIYGDRVLFEGVELRLNAKDRVGLVGPNGSGKTTLLRLLAGLQTATTGVVTPQPGLNLGYLRQEAVLTFAGKENTVYEEMLTVFAHLRQMETEQRALETKMADGSATADLLDTYGALQEAYEHAGGYQYQVDIKRVLLGLGFAQVDWDTPLAHLSGGQKTRVLLGRLLLEKSDLLILDEPTNHLDMAAIEWLEATLRAWPGALLMVSHDRYFLNRICSQIWALEGTNLKSYRGDYTSYVNQRQMQWAFEQKRFAEEKARLEKELAFIKKHIAGGKSDIAKGKLRRLTRDIVLIEQVGVVAQTNKSWLEVGGRVRPFSANEADVRLTALRAPDNAPPRLNIRLEVNEQGEKIALRTRALLIGYDETPLFQTEELKLERRQRVALIGPNGSGKSTLLRTLLGDIPLLKGKIFWGEGLQLAHFAQAHDQLNQENLVIDEVLQSDGAQAQGMNPAKARKFLAQYLFRGHDVFKTVAALSGGERGRLALALLALAQANCLLLDEPTNHLDIPSQEMLQSVLEGFPGTIILVSHDRYLVDGLATQIWAIVDGELQVFRGSYQAYLAARDGRQPPDEDEAYAAQIPAPVMIDPAAAAADLSWTADLAPEPVRLSKQERRQRARQLAALTEEIEAMEAVVEQIYYELEAARADNRPAPEIQLLQDEYTVAQAQLSALNDDWEALEGWG